MTAMLQRFARLARFLWPPPRRILKYNVAPRLGVRTVEARLRQRLPKLAGSLDSSIGARS
jgi:hypothetical protein